MLRTLHYLKAMGYEFAPLISFKNTNLPSFDELRENVKNCKLCNFCKQRKFSLMQKSFKKNTKLFIISTFASAKENQSGELLDDENGEFLSLNLNEILALNRDDFYFSYLFKCFSSKFDNFSLQSCFEYLLLELEIVQPKFILLLGEYPLQAFKFGDFGALKGEVFAYKNFWVMASFEPSFVLKNPSFKQEFINDLKKIKGFL